MRSSPSIFYYRSGNLRSITWYKSGRVHKDDGPAVTCYYDNGCRSIKSHTWFIDGNIHRIDNPAYIFYNEDGSINAETWNQNGKRHRIDGPAEISYEPNSISMSYWINDIEIKDLNDIELFKTEEGRAFLILKYGK